MMDYDYTVSSAFSSDPVDRLNTLAGELDCRLYAFAYYAPKRYDSVDSLGAREAFWMAVTNLYALYHDCSPFRKEPEAVFDKSNKPPIRLVKSFHDLLSKLRAMYCHNCSGEDNSLIVFEIIKFFESIDRNLDFLPDNDDFREANLLFDEVQWEKALCFLCKTSDEIIRQYNNRLTNLKNSPEKQKYIRKMLEKIASWTVTAYVGLWRFMEEYAQLGGQAVKDKTIENNWRSKGSVKALLRCTKDLLSPGNNAIVSTAYPLTLLMEAFKLCKGFDDMGGLQPLTY